MLNLAIIVNTHSSYSDIWPMFFGELEKFFPDQKVYIFSDVDLTGTNTKYVSVKYDPTLDFRSQYLSCLSSIQEPYCLTLNDDYVLTGEANKLELSAMLEIMGLDKLITQIRVAKGFNGTDKQYGTKYFYLDLNQDFFYTQSVAIWKTDILEAIHWLSPNSSIARKDNLPQLEVEANKVCQSMNLRGLYYFDNELKRGMYHYDSSIFPHIASALVGGKWNFREYPTQLLSLCKKYNIDSSIRGVY